MIAESDECCRHIFMIVRVTMALQMYAATAKGKKKLSDNVSFTIYISFFGLSQTLAQDN